MYETYINDKKDTPFFYAEVSKIIPTLESEILCTFFDIRDYKKVLLNEDKADDKNLIALFKILSPYHLLKLPFANDSNSLDKTFYSELLHIIGLTETKEGGKKIIQRPAEGQRNHGSLLENAMAQLDAMDKIGRLDNAGQFGATYNERLFNVGLELAITWINRILFLKLLEAQLVSYHKGDTDYAFLNYKRIQNFDDLNSLFFAVLARKPEDRQDEIKWQFAKVPYLNSSLFEVTTLENQAIVISNLRDERVLPILSGTVLKDNHGKKRTGTLNTIEYLFSFMDAYDFSSEGSEDIQEENKTLINASVLGSIFEKINGYKDGSFFTPGFITMYMCRETIRLAVLQKFNEAKGWNCTHFDELYNKIEDRKEANAIINSLKICDPAVGSGHFLVSALNELITIKRVLNVLMSSDGRTLRDYNVEVENDELIVTDENGNNFAYHAHNRESQRVQETLFHEKQTLIECCLFGVDINPNSVKICRLRLWIELLKNAYYKAESQFTELETLPNIDINIKCGNSLISRFALDADLKQALRNSKGAASRWTIDTYKIAVETYRNAKSKEEKRDMERLIEDIKGNFRSEISNNDPKLKKLSRLSGELYNLMSQHSLFEPSKTEKKLKKQTQEKLEKEISAISTEVEEIKSNKIYENAFEWRFEFPEVLNNDGDFLGFDVVIGNPPYIRQEELKDQKPYLQGNYETYSGTADLYVFFVERGMKLLKQAGYFCYILPNKWMKGGYGRALRNFAGKQKTMQMIDFGDLPVFEEATTYPSIWMMKRENVKTNTFIAAVVDTLKYDTDITAYLKNRWIKVSEDSLTEENWNLVDNRKQELLDKIKAAGQPLSSYVNGKIFRGVLTGLNEAFVIDIETKEKLIADDPKSAEIIKPFLAGRDIKRYKQPANDKWLILIPFGYTKNLLGKLPEPEAFQKMNSVFPAIFKFLKGHELKAKARGDKGDFWWELRPCDYYAEFEKPKILYQKIAAYSTFVYDRKGLYTNNKLFLIPTDDISLLGFLNTRLVWFYLNNTANILRGALALQSPYILALPFVEDLKNNTKIGLITTAILELKAANSLADTSILESQIDQLVYGLYGLTEEEIGIVEG